MLFNIAVILFIAWILGFSFHVAGSFVHLVLLIAVILAVAHFFRGKRMVS